jgi:hypothetical protein
LIDSRIIVGDQVELAQIQTNAFEPALQQSPPLYYSCKLGGRLLPPSAGLVSPGGYFLASSIESLPGDLPDSLLPFELCDPIANLSDAFFSSTLGFQEGPPACIKSLTFGLAFGSSTADQGQRFGVAGDPGLQRLEIVKSRSFDPLSCFEVPSSGGSPALGAGSFAFTDFELYASRFKSSEARSIRLCDMHPGCGDHIPFGGDRSKVGVPLNDPPGRFPPGSENDVTEERIGDPLVGLRSEEINESVQAEFGSGCACRDICRLLWVDEGDATQTVRLQVAGQTADGRPI